MITQTLLFWVKYITVECNRSEICDTWNTHCNPVSAISLPRTRWSWHEEIRSDNVSSGARLSCRCVEEIAFNVASNLTEELSAYWRPLAWIIIFLRQAMWVSNRYPRLLLRFMRRYIPTRSLIARSRERLLRKLLGTSIIRSLSWLRCAHKSSILQRLFRVFQI